MSKKYFTIISLLTIFTTLLFLGVNTAFSKELDPRCFTRSQCFKQREFRGAKNPKDSAAFYNQGKAKKVCPKQESKGKKVQMGFCLPPGQANTQIKFAGRGSFVNAGQFIQFMYKWSMIAGATLAVLMILVAGIQWAVSGGRKKIIKKAKKRIAGSIGGLVLLATSFLILNTINPALVNLRLPQTWMLKGFSISGADWCQSIEKNKKIAPAVNLEGEKIKHSNKKFKIKPEEAKCGAVYYTSKRDKSKFCYGLRCAQNKQDACVPLIDKISEDNEEVRNMGITAKSRCKQGIQLSLMVAPGAELQDEKKAEVEGGAGWIGYYSWLNEEGSIEAENWLAIQDGWLSTGGLQGWVICDKKIEGKNVVKNDDLHGTVGQSYHTMPTTYVVQVNKNSLFNLKNKCKKEALGFVMSAQVDKKGDTTEDALFITSLGQVNEYQLQGETGTKEEFIDLKTDFRNKQSSKRGINVNNYKSWVGQDYINFKNLNQSKFMQVELTTNILKKISN